MAIVLLSLTAPLALKSLDDQSRLLERLTTAEFDKFATIVTLERAIPEASDNLNRVTALVSNSNEAAAGELTASIAEIGQQISRVAVVAGRAVDEAQQTDATVQGLSAAAQKIGGVNPGATSIASVVEEQGSVAQEISRNTQQAA